MIFICDFVIHSKPYIIVCIHHWTRSAMVQVMAPPVQQAITWTDADMGQVMELWLSCYLVLLSIDSKTR